MEWLWTYQSVGTLTIVGTHLHVVTPPQMLLSLVEGVNVRDKCECRAWHLSHWPCLVSSHLIPERQDDAAMEAYLEGEEPDVATLQALIRKGTIGGAFVPVMCGTAFKNKGVQPLLDAVVSYLPSPLDIPAMKVGGWIGRLRMVVC